MRAISADYDALLTSPGGVVRRCRVQVKNSGGTFIDLTTYPGRDFVVSAGWGESVDSNGHDCTISIRRADEKLSVSPFMENSPLNRAFAYPGTYAPLVDIGREVKVEWSISATDTPTYVIGFHGYIDGFNPAGDDVLKLTARGQYSLILDAFIEQERTYAFADPADGDALKGCRVYTNGDTYAVNELVVPSEHKLNSHFYKVTSITTGIGGTEGTWNTGSGSTTTFGGVTFTEVGATTTTTGTAVETVIQQIINDNVSSPPTVTTPASPSWLIRAYKQQRAGAFAAIRALADQIGWDLRYVWNSGLSDYRLEFRAVDRTKTTPDRTFNPNEHFRIQRLETRLDGIRNVIRVIFLDSQDLDAGLKAKRKVIEVSDSTSITKYGRRFMEVAEEKTANIDTTTEATTFANAMLSDLKNPVAELEVEMPFFPFVELGDLYRFKADGIHFDVDQDLAVVGYSHNLAGGDKPKAMTTVTCRGKPSGGYTRWLHAETGRGKNNHAVSQLQGFSTTLTVDTRTPGGAKLKVDEFFSKHAIAAGYEFHLSKSAGFTPGSTTLKQQGFDMNYQFQNGDPGDTYYAQTVPWHFNSQQIVRGQPSNEISFVPGYLEPRHINSESFRGELPPNGSFEGFTREEGLGVPPDNWEMQTGAWTTDVAAGPAKGGVDARDGARYLRWLNTSVATAVRSKWFPVNGGNAHHLRFWIYRASMGNSVDFQVEWVTATKSAISTSTFTIAYSDLTDAAWNTRGTTVFAPTTAAFARVVIKKASANTDTFHVDGVSLQDIGSPWREIGATGEPSFEDTWTNYGGGESNVAFRRDSLGVWHLKGLMSSGTINVVAFTLPVEARPATPRRFACVSNAAFGYFSIASNGQVLPVVGNNAFFGFDGTYWTVWD